MPQGLTRRLSGILLFCGLWGALALPAAAEEAQLSSDEQVNYLNEIKRLYLTQDERAALLAHSNALLETYALRAGYQVGKPDRRSLQYRLSVSAPGELSVREESRAEKGVEMTVNRQNLSVFGVDPYVHYECPVSGITCTLRNPVDGSPWLQILRDQRGAAELAKAISFLIRNVQKGK